MSMPVTGFQTAVVSSVGLNTRRLTALAEIVKLSSIKDFSQEAFERTEVQMCRTLAVYGQVLSALQGDTGAHAQVIRVALLDRLQYLASTEEGKSFEGDAYRAVYSGVAKSALDLAPALLEAANAAIVEIYSLPQDRRLVKDKALAKLSKEEKAIRGNMNVVKGVRYTVQGLTLSMRNHAQDSTTRIDLSKFVGALAQAQQVLCLTLQNGAYEKTKFQGNVQRAILALSGKCDFSGLVETPHYFQVMVYDAASGEVAAVKQPFFFNKDGEWTALGLAVRSMGFISCLSVDGWTKQGYVVAETNVLAGDSIFGEQGTGADSASVLSPEAIAKLIVRDSKQVGKDEKDGTVTVNVTGIVVALPEITLNKVVEGLGTDTEKAAVLNLKASFGVGCSGGSEALMSLFGVNRAVSCGKNGLGLKSVVGEMGHVVHPDIVAAAEKRAGSFDGKLVYVTGLGAVKAKAANLVWDAVNVGGVDYLVSVHHDTDYTATESAAALCYENVADDSMSIQAWASQLENRVLGNKTSTVWQKLIQLYMDEGLTVVEGLQQLLADGVIKHKNLKAQTNLQMLQSMEMQYGRQSVIDFLKAAYEGKGKSAARKIQYVLQLMTPSAIEDKDVAGTLSFKSLYANYITACDEMDIDPEAQGTNIPALLAMTLLNKMGGRRDTDFVRINFDEAGTVLLPIAAMCGMWEESNNGRVLVSGLLAELVELLATVKCENGVVTDATLSYNFKRMVKVRDKLVGKALARIPCFGQAGLICSSYKLAYGEVMSSTLSSQRSKASKAYDLAEEFLQLIWAKSPCVMTGAVSLVTLVWKNMNLTKDSKFINGTAIYANWEFILEKQDDADGDKTSVYVVPAVLDAAKNIRPTHNSNPIWKVTEAHVANETAGLFVGKKEEVVVHQYTADELMYAVFAAAKAKANVGLFTSFQQQVSSHKQVFQEAASELLMRGGWLSMTLGSLIQVDEESIIGLPKHQANFVAQALWTIWHQLSGGIMQIQAMDMIKRVDGIVAKGLAEILSANNMGKFHLPVDVAEAEAMVASGRFGDEKFAGKSGDALLKAVQKSLNAKFNDEAIGATDLIDHYQIDLSNNLCATVFKNTFGVTDAEKLSQLVVVLGLHVQKVVGKVDMTTYDPAALIFAGDSKVAKYVHNLETLAASQELVVGDRVLAQKAQNNLQLTLAVLAKQVQM